MLAQTCRRLGWDEVLEVGGVRRNLVDGDRRSPRPDFPHRLESERADLLLRLSELDRQRKWNRAHGADLSGKELHASWAGLAELHDQLQAVHVSESWRIGNSVVRAVLTVTRPAATVLSPLRRAWRRRAGNLSRTYKRATAVTSPLVTLRAGPGIRANGPFGNSNAARPQTDAPYFRCYRSSSPSAPQMLSGLRVASSPVPAAVPISCAKSVGTRLARADSQSQLGSYPRDQVSVLVADPPEKPRHLDLRFGNEKEGRSTIQPVGDARPWLSPTASGTLVSWSARTSISWPEAGFFRTAGV
jgi:hypothetical protein